MQGLQQGLARRGGRVGRARGGTARAPKRAIRGHCWTLGEALLRSVLLGTVMPVSISGRGAAPPPEGSSDQPFIRPASVQHPSSIPPASVQQPHHRRREIRVHGSLPRRAEPHRSDPALFEPLLRRRFGTQKALARGRRCTSSGASYYRCSGVRLVAPYQYDVRCYSGFPGSAACLAIVWFGEFGPRFSYKLGRHRGQRSREER